MTSELRYSHSFLLFLRQSPLCTKPEKLPPKDELEKWMDVRQSKDEQNTSARKRVPSSNESALAENPLARFAAGARKNVRGQPGDIILGPPKMGFTSNNRNAGRTPDDSTKERGGDFQDGFFRVRSNDTREKVPRRTRETGDDGFTVVRNRRSSQAEDGASRWIDRDERPDRGEREKRDPLDVSVRKNGNGRGFANFDKAWIRPENGETGDSNTFETKPMSWRNKDSQRSGEQRGWGRNTKGDSHNEEQPEWMADDTPVPMNEPIVNNAKTQEDFQAWKEAMRAKGDGIKKEEKSDVAKPPGPVSSKSATLIPTLGTMFGTFEDKKTDEISETARPAAPVKSKSRFEGFFKKEEPPPPLPFEQARPTSSGNLNGNAEDKAGFDRILAMLAGSTTPQPHLTQPPGLSPNRGLGSPEADNAMDHRNERHRENAGFMDEVLARQMAGARIGGQHQNHPFMDRQGAAGNTKMEKDPRQDSFSPRNVDSNQQAQRDFLYNLMMSQRPEVPQRSGEPLEFGQFGAQPKGVPQQQPHNQLNQRNPSAPPGLDPQHRLLAEQDFGGQRRPGPPSGLPPFFEHHDAAILEHNIPPPGLARRNTEGTGLSSNQPQQQQNIPRQGPPQGQNGPQAAAQASNLGIPSLRMNDLFMRNGAPNGPPHAVPHDSRIHPGHPPPGLMPSGPLPPSQQNQQPGPQSNRQPPQNGPNMPPPPPGFGGAPGMPPPMNFPPGPGHPPPFGMPPFFGPGPGPMGMPPMPPNGMNGMNGPPPGQGFFPGRFPFDGPMPNGPPQGDRRQF